MAVKRILSSEQRQVLATKSQAIANNLPSWSTVKAAIDAAFLDTKQNNVITKLTRVVYLDVKNKET